MATIRAGNTLVSQYAPPFVVSNNIAENWHLRWNSTLKAFEAYDPAALIDTDGGFNSIESYGPIPGNGGQDFVLPWEPLNKASLFITVNGVKQEQDAYSLPGNNVVHMMAAIDPGDTIEFIGLQAKSVDNIHLYTDVSDGVTTDYTLTWLAPSAAGVIVTVNGIKQTINSYSLLVAGNVSILSFNVAPALNEVIEVLGISSTGEAPSSPVYGSNLPGGDAELYSGRTISGETQVLEFRSLLEGPGITLTESGNYITVEGTTFSNYGNSSIDGLIVNPNASNIQVRMLSPGQGISINTATEGHLLIAATGYGGYLGVSNDHVMGTNTKIVGVTDTSSPRTVTLPVVTTSNPDMRGHRVVIKDESGNANNNNITIVTPGAQTIDGQANYVINQAYGSVTLYTNGTNWFVIG